MLYLKAKLVLFLSVCFLMCAFFTAVFQSLHIFLIVSVLAIFFAIMHVKYDWAYLDYDDNHTKQGA